MALVRDIIRDALIENGYLALGDTPSAAIQQLGFRWLVRMIDAWGADRLTFSEQLRTVYSWPDGEASQTVGTGGDIDIVRPMFLDSLAYIVPASDPEVESPIGLMDQDAFAALSIKALESALPIQGFYQRGINTTLGTLQLWPVPNAVDIVLYSSQAVAIPVSVNTNMTGPNAYLDAYHYGLAQRLVTPTGVPMPPDLPRLASAAAQAIGRLNADPGQLAVDPAVAPWGGAGYNILSDVMQTSRG